MSVTQLGYIGFDVAKSALWDDLLTDVLGLERRADQPDGAASLYRIDDRHHRFALYPSKTDAIRYIGWEVASRQALEETAAKLTKLGTAVTEGTKAEAASRAVSGLIRFSGPDGLPLELYYGPLIDEVAFRPGAPISGFNAGALGLGHIVIAASNYPAAVEFYTAVLGFRLSDYIVWADADATFLHCNPRHHSLAVMNECFGMKGGDLAHFMLETKSLDDVGRAWDIVRDRNIPITMDLGRHTNDRMTSFYLRSPSGFSIEYGYGGILVDDEDWQIKRYHATKIWGHAIPDAPPAASTAGGARG